MTRPVLAVTPGDLDGIGPEVMLRALAAPEVLGACEPVIVAPRADLEAAAHSQRLPWPPPDGVRWYEPPPAEGAPPPRRALDAALDLVLARRADGLCTAPASKHGLGGSGHTEVLQARSGAAEAYMLFVGPRLRVLCATGHLPLREVPGAIEPRRLAGAIRLLDRALRDGHGLAAPRIGVCGINPHAGEDGLYGHEDAERVAPAVALAREAGVNARGPFGADGLIGTAVAGGWDGVVALFHDQGLSAFKALHFHEGVHVTAGLPFVRTSPVHGTARELVGQGLADPRSMREALLLAARLCAARR